MARAVAARTMSGALVPVSAIEGDSPTATREAAGTAADGRTTGASGAPESSSGTEPAGSVPGAVAGAVAGAGALSVISLTPGPSSAGSPAAGSHSSPTPSES